MAGITKGAVIKLILQYIGGNPLMQISSVTVAGQPVAIQAGLGSISSFASEFSSFSAELEAGLSEIDGISSQLQGLTSGISGIDSLTNELSSLNTLGSVDSLTALATQMGESADGLQSGLGYLSKNPLDTNISSTKQTIANYATNGYASLSQQLPQVSSNPNLTSAYNNLKNAVGGPDGKTGAVVQLDAYKSHTDRLAGVTVSSDSDSYEPEETTEESAFYYDTPSNIPTTIISFSTNKIRSAKYFVQGSVGVDHQTSEVYVIHDSNTVFTREVGLIFTRNPFIKYTSKIVNNTLSVLATSSIANVDLVVYGVKLQIASKSSSQDNISQEKILSAARSMSGFYPNDKTDYIRKQASSLMEPTALVTLEEYIKNMVTNFSNDRFNNMSDVEKANYINEYSNTINSLTNSLQNSIDDDVEAQKEIDKKLESASAVYTVSSNYNDPNARALLDLTLTDSVKRAL